MPSVDPLFERPIDPEVFSSLREWFAEAAAKYPPITHTLIFMADPWPLPAAMPGSLGKDNRSTIRAGTSTRTEPPFELIFAKRDAWDRYVELAAYAAQHFPLWAHDEWQLNRWTYTLYRLAWRGDAVSFRALHKLVRLYPGGSVLTVPGKADHAWPAIAAREQAEGLSGHTAETYCCQLLDLWAVSRESLDLWAKQKVGAGSASLDDETTASEKRKSMTWQEAAERMERLRSQGEPWGSQHDMAERLGCSSFTINKAIKMTPRLQNWAKQPTATPKAQSLNDVVTDRTAQSGELNPEDDAAIREFIEGADPETKAWILALSREDQLEVINDPDKHQRVLGRKP